LKKLHALAVLLLILPGISAVTPYVAAQVCNLTNVRTQYPQAVHPAENFQVLVELTAGCDYSGRIVLKVNLVDGITNQVLSTASWTWFRSYGSTVTTVSPWIDLEATAPSTPGYWQLILYAYNVDGEGTSSVFPFQVQVL